MRDSELRGRWVEALRSGHYSQVRGVLACDEGYCCLGVLGDITNQLVSSGVKEWKLPSGEIYHNLREVSYKIPEGVWTELDYEVARELVDMNDGGASFEQIANYIENNL